MYFICCVGLSYVSITLVCVCTKDTTFILIGTIFFCP
jgi:hypothetical protein